MSLFTSLTHHEVGSLSFLSQPYVVIDFLPASKSTTFLMFPQLNKLITGLCFRIFLAPLSVTLHTLLYVSHYVSLDP